jgi:hypothetical protein
VPAGQKRNVRELGASVLLRDPTLAQKLAVIYQVEQAGSDPASIPSVARREIERFSGFSWKTILQWCRRKTEFSAQFSKLKLGKWGLRPFGSCLAHKKRKSKSLGEIPHENMSIIRTSIIGKEVHSTSSLLSWFLSQPHGAVVPGFTDQIWNGVTVHHFAKFVKGIIEKKTFNNYAGVHHVVPADKVTKEGLLRNMASAFHREDIEVMPVSSGRALDMTLSTNNPQLSDSLWKNAGYSRPLSIEEMVVEYSLAIRAGGY